MTKKEKIELAARLQAEIDSKKETKERISTEEIQARYPHRMQMLDKARNKKGDFFTGARHRYKKPLQDYDPWSKLTSLPRHRRIILKRVGGILHCILKTSN